MLYFRQLLILVVNLYSVRVVLDVLGAEDYGLYNVVAGIVTMFSFLNMSMAAATQRFFSFALGKNDNEQLKKIFSVNIVIYIGIALIALLLLETVGLWFVNDHLDIPENRFEAAHFIYHFAVLTFIISILTSPFMAIIIAHEDMQIYAYVSIIEALLKLGIVFLLMYIDVDKLELYGVLLFIVAVINAIIYITISLRKYEECQFKKKYWDKDLAKEITNFTGWTLLGEISVVTKNQGVTILINQFYNPVIVASRSIAMSVGNYIRMFANNFNTSLYPPIVKSYSSENKGELFSLIGNGSKITYFLMWVVALPFFLELEFIFSLWLKNTPPDTILFTRLKIIESLIVSICLPLTTAVRASGKVKTFELITGTIQLLIFAISLVVLRLGYPAYSVFVISIIANVIIYIIKVIIMRSYIKMSIIHYLRKVFVPICFMMLCSYLSSVLLQSLLPRDIIYSLIVILFSVMFSSLSSYYLLLDKNWRKKIKYHIHRKFRKYI